MQSELTTRKESQKGRFRRGSGLRLVTLMAFSFVLGTTNDAWATSIARVWNEQILNAIRIDTPHPPAHARNLFHLSVAMYDAWASFDEKSVGYVYRQKHIADFQPHDMERARDIIISHAAYTVLKSRYRISINAPASEEAFRLQMLILGLNSSDTSTEGNSPAAIGNRIGNAILDFGRTDGSREEFIYRDFSYSPVNLPLILSSPTQEMDDPNRWQPLAFDTAFTQNGLEADEVQRFLGSHWGEVRPFALTETGSAGIYHDPGLPPQIGGEGDAEYKAGNVEVLYYSSLLDPDQGVMMDISPGARGNNSLGSNDGKGHPVNPHTGLPYTANVVNQADFGRVVAEYWADGPHSETPPGHWNVIANKVADHPLLEKRIEGKGPIVSDLEWDVKTYLALNAAVHDAAIAAWGCKRVYDYVRPITSIRYMAKRGQSSDPSLPSYHPHGIPLIDNLIELVTEESSAPGERHENFGSFIGEIVVRAWVGEPEDKQNTYSGVDWILARTWFPYQRDTFVTPAFAGYVSGHSTFSRAAAEVLTRMTGSPYFPGGIGSFTAERNNFLHFEMGPSQTVVLQWATYFDAADEAGLSRLYGGIHVPVDDGPGRIMGSECGIECWNLARLFFNGTQNIRMSPISIAGTANGDIDLSFETPGEGRYKIQTSDNLTDWDNMIDWFKPLNQTFSIRIPSAQLGSNARFFRVLNENPNSIPSAQ